MSPEIATIVYLLGILGLFVLDRDRNDRTSKTLWLPVTWLWLAGSRTPSEWMGIWGLGSFGTQMNSADKYLEGSPFDAYIFLAMTVMGVIVLARKQQRIGKLLRENGPAFWFFAYCVISCIWSEHPDVALKRWIKAIGDLVMVLIVLAEVDLSAATKRLLSRVGFILVPLSILFIKYYPAWGREYSHFDGRGTFTGITTTKNLLGMACLISGLGPLWRLRQAFTGVEGARKSKQLIAQGALLAMAIYVLLIADSATSTSCFLMAGALLAVTSLGRAGRKPMVVHLVVFGLIAVSALAALGGNLVGAVGRDSTLTGRTDIWNLVLSLRGNLMLGTGFESFWLGWRRERLWNVYRFHLNEAHNGYIEVFLNLGWVGVGFLALLIASGYRNAIAAFKRDPNMGSLKLAYFMIAVIYNLSESGFRMQDPVWIFFLWAILAVPERPVPDHIPLAETDHAEELYELEPQVDPVFNSQSIQETL